SASSSGTIQLIRKEEVKISSPWGVGRELSDDGAIARRIGAGKSAFGSAGVNGDSCVLRELGGLGVENLGSGFRHFLCLFVGKLRNAFGSFDHAGIGGANAAEIGTDPAPFGI